ncbi:MAG: methionyl-tRNA formyltransferase [Candidatus Omnitrophica bacterium]|nr:methionyl-tRNA formyltransferase [Candidatus Omnitrophota bacterium]
MRIVYIGAVEFSQKALEKLISLRADIAGVITMKKSDFNADFCDLSRICKKNNIAYKYTNDINANDNVKWIKNLKPDIIFCFGYSQMLKKHMLKLAPMGCVGFHPAKLPQNRGRHPIIWALALGLKETASTFFFMDEGADSGDILSQKDVEIDYKDDARSLYNKITKTALKQIEVFIPKLKKNIFQMIPQDDKAATYWRKRHKADGRIDFRMTGEAIYNLVRALTKPYIGAHVIYKNQEIKIWKAKEVKCNLRNVEYGKVLLSNKKEIVVKCYDNAICFTQHGFKKLPKQGEHIL